MRHILDLDLSILIEENILHPKHALEPTMKTSKASLTALPADVLKCLKNLKARLNEKLLTKVGLLRLIRTIQIKKRQIIRLTDDVDAVLHVGVRY